MGGGMTKILTPESREELRLLKQDLGLAVKRADEAARGSLTSACDHDVSARASKSHGLAASMKRRIAAIEGLALRVIAAGDDDASLRQLHK
jgi:hypothetical protein